MQGKRMTGLLPIEPALVAGLSVLAGAAAALRPVQGVARARLRLRRA